MEDFFNLSLIGMLLGVNVLLQLLSMYMDNNRPTALSSIEWHMSRLTLDDIKGFLIKLLSNPIVKELIVEIMEDHDRNKIKAEIEGRKNINIKKGRHNGRM